MARKVMPILSDFGFSMSFSDKGCYQFENCQEHSNITFEIPPGCPPSLYAEYVERMRETGQTGLLPRLTTSYGIRHRRAFQWSYLLFNSSQLHSCGDFFYSTQDELDSKLQQVAYEYVSTIHPLIYIALTAESQAKTFSYNIESGEILCLSNHGYDGIFIANNMIFEYVSNHGIYCIEKDVYLST